jgi:hypothetical protein
MADATKLGPAEGVPIVSTATSPFVLGLAESRRDDLSPGGLSAL